MKEQRELAWDRLVFIEKEADRRWEQESRKMAQLNSMIESVKERRPDPKDRTRRNLISTLRYKIRLARKRQKYHGLKWAKALHQQAALLTQESVEELSCASGLFA